MAPSENARPSQQGFHSHSRLEPTVTADHTPIVGRLDRIGPGSLTGNLGGGIAGPDQELPVRPGVRHHIPVNPVDFMAADEVHCPAFFSAAAALSTRRA